MDEGSVEPESGGRSTLRRTDRRYAVRSTRWCRNQHSGSRENSSLVRLAWNGRTLFDQTQDGKDSCRAAPRQRQRRARRQGREQTSVVFLCVELLAIDDQLAVGRKRVTALARAVADVAADSNDELRLHFDDDVAVRNDARCEGIERLHLGR